MPTLIHNGRDKEKHVDFLRLILQEYTFNVATIEQRAAVLAHLEYLKRSQNTLLISCKLETTPELSLTRITLDLTLQPT